MPFIEVGCFVVGRPYMQKSSKRNKLEKVDDQR